LITYNTEWVEENISHTLWAFKWALRNGFDDLADIVASHHGRVEWGALFEPKTTEAWALHMGDMTSARLGKITIDKLEGK